MNNKGLLKGERRQRRGGMKAISVQGTKYTQHTPQLEGRGSYKNPIMPLIVDLNTKHEGRNALVTVSKLDLTHKVHYPCV